MNAFKLFCTILLFYNHGVPEISADVSKGPRFYPKSYVIPNDQPFMVMEAKEAFDALTDKEQFYAHYLSKYVKFNSIDARFLIASYTRILRIGF